MFDTGNDYSSQNSDFVSQHLTVSGKKQARIQQLEDDLCELAAHIDAALFHWLELLRELSCQFDGDGFLILKGRFAPEQGALIRQALNAALDELHEERKNVSAETSVMEEPSHLKPAPPAAASRRADALARMAEAFLSGPESASRGDHYVVNIHTDMETLKDTGCGAESQLEDGPNVSAETSRRLCCDAGMVHWLDAQAPGSGGIEPLSVGRKTRTVPPSIRRALQRRDGGCRFPGCSCTRFVDAHHIHHWADGGETSMNNLVLLCRHHHRLVHEGGFGLRPSLTGVFEFTAPEGRLIPSAPELRFNGSLLELKANNEGDGVSITSTTSVPNWGGESMDVDIVVHHLQRRE
ncbi:MAG: DUF222 domain-containing protein [Xanthomonadales bacterium]|nr:DUF222 domain-containing protein [Xanthomonadales bacterium]